jgi:hypothetical protein
MKYLKSYKQYEDVACATTAGMGAVTSSQPSSTPGALNGPAFINGGGSIGSGDVSSTLTNTNKKRKIKRSKKVKIVEKQ